MLDIDKFTAKKEFVSVEGQSVEVTALTFNELKVFMKYAEKDDTDKASDFILFSTLRKNVPTKEENAEKGKSDEELWKFIKTNIDGKKAAEIIQAVQRLSGIGDEPDTSKKEVAKEKSQEKKQPNPSAKE